MWYRSASAETAVEKVAEELIKNYVRDLYFRETYRYPTNGELGRIVKIIKNRIKYKFGSIMRQRKDTMERQLKRIVNDMLDEIKIVHLVQ